MSEEPIVLDIKKEDKEVYDEIRSNGPLKGKQTKEVFLLAASLGYSNKTRIKLSGNRISYVRTEYLDKEDKVLINSIAINENNSLDILQDKDEIFKIIEEYAHAGLPLLRELVLDKDKGSFIKKFEALLRDNLVKDNKNKGIE